METANATATRNWTLAVIAAGFVFVICLAFSGVRAYGMVAGHGGSSVKSFCKEAVADNAKWQQESDSGASDSQRNAAVKEFKRLADHAPNEIKADMQTATSALSKVASGDGASVDTTSLDAADQRVGNYMNSHCGGGLIDFTS